MLHLLHELEAGAEPDEIVPYVELLPKPVARLPHEGDAEEPSDAVADDAAAGSTPADTGSKGRTPSSGRRPSARRGPGGPPAGRGTQSKTKGRHPGTKRR